MERADASVGSLPSGVWRIVAPGSAELARRIPSCRLSPGNETRKFTRRSISTAAIRAL